MSMKDSPKPNARPSEPAPAPTPLNPTEKAEWSEQESERLEKLAPHLPDRHLAVKALDLARSHRALAGLRRKQAAHEASQGQSSMSPQGQEATTSHQAPPISGTELETSAKMNSPRTEGHKQGDQDPLTKTSRWQRFKPGLNEDYLNVLWLLAAFSSACAFDVACHLFPMPLYEFAAQVFAFALVGVGCYVLLVWLIALIVGKLSGTEILSFQLRDGGGNREMALIFSSIIVTSIVVVFISIRTYEPTRGHDYYLRYKDLKPSQW